MDNPPHVMIVEARYYEDVVDELVRGAAGALEAVGASSERFEVPGAFEIPSAIQIAIRSMDFFTARQRFDGFIALGCVIRGETSHYDYVCGESARALQEISVANTLALGYGILTVENRDQAWERASVDGRNKGGEAARACLDMVDLKRRFHLYPR